MSTSTVKGDRKREIGQSPIKKKIKDFTISREDIDDAVANGIKLAFKEQQSTSDSAMASTVRDAVNSVLTPALRELRADIQADIQATNNSVKELRVELEALANATKQTRDRVDSVQAAAREDRRAVTDLSYGTGVSREVSTLFGRRRILSAPCHRRGHLLRLHKAAGRRRPPSLRPGGRGLLAGIEEMPAARKKMVARGIWMLASRAAQLIDFLIAITITDATIM